MGSSNSVPNFDTLVREISRLNSICSSLEFKLCYGYNIYLYYVASDPNCCSGKAIQIYPIMYLEPDGGKDYDVIDSPKIFADNTQVIDIKAMNINEFYHIYEPIKLNHEFLANIVCNEVKEKEVCSICLDNQIEVVLPGCLV